MKRLTLFSKLILFLTSYIPLGVICLIIDFEKITYPFFKHGILSLILLVFIILLPIFLFSLIRHFSEKPTGWEKMQIVPGSVENMDKEILSYIFSYILPFLGFPEERRIFVAVFLLFVIGIIYTRSDMIGINPLLAIFGYHIIKTKWKKGNDGKQAEAILISRADYYEIEQAGMIEAIQMYNELYMIRGGQNDR